jgi:adenine deaminase
LVDATLTSGTKLAPLNPLAPPTNPALFLGLAKVWGRVEPGYSANLVLLNADLLADISNTSNIYCVVVNGEFLNCARLDQLLGHAEARVDKGVSEKR